MRLDVVYPSNLESGMVVLGTFQNDAPTTPVQPYAAAMTVERIESADDGEVPGFRLTWKGNMDGGWHRRYDRHLQFLVLRLDPMNRYCLALGRRAPNGRVPCGSGTTPGVGVIPAALPEAIAVAHATVQSESDDSNDGVVLDALAVYANACPETATVVQMQALVDLVDAAAVGGSNDEEIDALAQALSTALTRWPGIHVSRECHRNGKAPTT